MIPSQTSAFVIEPHTLTPMAPVPPRPRSTLLSILLLWIAFYASFTLVTPPLLDDADSVHAEVAREMLMRHDYVTLYANGIRYLEKAPLLYWSMAASMHLFQSFGATSPTALAAATRVPLALTILALALLIEAFARRLFASAHAGLYAALIILSSFGLFLFTRINIPDAMVCLWTTLALYAFNRTEELSLSPPQIRVPHVSLLRRGFSTLLYSCLFAIACALNVLTKGLIGIVFPVAIVLLYLLLTRGLKNTLTRLRQLHPFTSLLLFLVIAAPWHILAGLANPTQGHPAAFHFIHGHWQIPLPTDGNVRGWFWFYFMNEHLLRYLNLRIPHDYDTAPLWLFWGLCLIWLMPWSAFVFKAAGMIRPNFQEMFRIPILSKTGPLMTRFLGCCRLHRLKSITFLSIWAGFVLLFFSLSTRQEYYVLPALPAIAILIAGWLTIDSRCPWPPVTTAAKNTRRANIRITSILLALGTLFLIAATIFLLHTHNPVPNADLATLLSQNPGDYALSMGHFLDITGPALSLFRLPLIIAALALFGGPLAALLLRKRTKPHAANLALAAGAFTFLLAAHLGLQTFAPVLTSAQLAQAIAPQVHQDDILIIHGEYESASSLAFYLQRPTDFTDEGPEDAPGIGPHLYAIHEIGILDGRSSNLWYGSFFPDAPKLFFQSDDLVRYWRGPQRIFLWQSLTDPPNQLPPLPTPVYILVNSGGKEIVSNQPNH
jgi:4-amino-4-deoxy-L-arabinose transferase-like glycosyltransferase